MMRILIFALALLALPACDQTLARSFGGDTNHDLPPCHRLVMVTWKEDSLWFLTRLMQDGETPERYVFSESSSMGVLEGQVRIQEHACGE